MKGTIGNQGVANVKQLAHDAKTVKSILAELNTYPDTKACQVSIGELITDNVKKAYELKSLAKQLESRLLGYQDNDKDCDTPMPSVIAAQLSNSNIDLNIAINIFTNLLTSLGS